MVTDLQKRAAQAIVNIFETGKVEGDYASVVFVAGDPGGLTYGRSQTTLNSGNLYLLIKAYCDEPGADFAAQLRPVLNRLAAKDQSLNRNATLRRLLERAGKEDPVMWKVQDEFFDRVYWNPAVKRATAIGIQSALGTAVVYDSTVHGSWERMRDRTIERHGTVTKIGEATWITKYVDVRREWLANHPTIPLLRKTVYRMDSFKQLIAAGNWELKLPFTIRGLVINQETLQATSPGSAEVEETRLLRLTVPYMTGDDVRKLQEALNKEFAKRSIKDIKLQVDGVFGPGTDAAVKRFQKLEKLVADGIVGPATRAELGL